jgi:single-strand DNA-binding protein
MGAVNRVMMIGRLGRKPELKHTNQGTAVCSFSIAINQKKDEAPLWVNVVAWEKTAESVARYLDKGASVFVDGRLDCRKYEKDGVEKERWEVIAHQVVFLDGKQPERGGSGESRNGESRGGGDDDRQADDDSKKWYE